MTGSAQSKAPADVVRHFRLRNIWLQGAHFARPNDPPDQPELKLVQQSKRSVGFARKEIREGAEAKQLLFVLVEFGTRVKAQPDADPTIYFEIEADFVAEYELTHGVADELVQQFADLNAVHNVWPFWRQHVFDIVQRGNLPQVEIPLFSDNPRSDAPRAGDELVSHNH